MSNARTADNTPHPAASSSGASTSGAFTRVDDPTPRPRSALAPEHTHDPLDAITDPRLRHRIRAIVRQVNTQVDDRREWERSKHLPHLSPRKYRSTWVLTSPWGVTITCHKLSQASGEFTRLTWMRDGHQWETRFETGNTVSTSPDAAGPMSNPHWAPTPAPPGMPRRAAPPYRMT